MQVGGPDRCPFVVDQHDLCMHVDIAASTLCIQRGNSDQGEIFIPAELCYLVEERPALRIAACRADILLRLGRHQDDNIDSPPQCLLECDGDLRIGSA